MRKNFRRGTVTAALLLSMSLTACAGGNRSAQTAAETAQAETTDVKEKESDDLPFPLGQKIDSPSFTGAAYIEPMIQKDDTYHFPSTNHITFEPGARSSWHSHGGMILLATGGIGYYQEEGKPAQILRKAEEAQN